MSTSAVLKGALSGLVGAAVMTAGEKAEQRLTHRPDSYVPGRTLSALLGRRLPRLSTDQTLENATGVGAPPQTWPAREHVVDVLHKGVYSVATGLLSDALVPTRVRPLPGRVSH